MLARVVVVPVVLVVIVVVMSKWMSENMAVVTYPPKSYEANRSPETARPRQVSTTLQPSRSPAKERASQPNSASDDFSKLSLIHI